MLDIAGVHNRVISSSCEQFEAAPLVPKLQLGNACVFRSSASLKAALSETLSGEAELQVRSQAGAWERGARVERGRYIRTRSALVAGIQPR